MLSDKQGSEEGLLRDQKEIKLKMKQTSNKAQSQHSFDSINESASLAQRSGIRVTNTKVSKPGLRLDDEAILSNEELPKHTSAVRTPDSEQLNTFVLNTIQQSSPSRISSKKGQNPQPTAQVVMTNNAVLSTARSSSHAFKTTERPENGAKIRASPSPETYSTLPVESPDSMFKTPELPLSTKNSKRPKLPPVPIHRARSDDTRPAHSQLANVGKLYSIINNNLDPNDSRDRLPGKLKSPNLSTHSSQRSYQHTESRYKYGGKKKETNTIVKTIQNYTPGEVNSGQSSPIFYARQKKSAFLNSLGKCEEGGRTGSPVFPFRPPYSPISQQMRRKTQAYMSDLKDSRGDIEYSAGLSLSHVLSRGDHLKHSLQRASEADSIPGWSIYAMLPGISQNELGGWLQAQCTAAAAGSTIVIPENPSVYLKHGLQIEKPLILKGSPGTKVQVPMGQSITVRLSKQYGDQAVLFKECELSLVNPRLSEQEEVALNFDTQPDEVEFPSLFKLEGQTSQLEMTDCALSCQKSHSPLTAFSVSREGSEGLSSRLSDCRSMLWLKSCYVSKFSYGIIGKHNTIVNVEKSHFIHIKGAAIAMTDPIWCKMVSTVVENSGAHAIAITLTHECIEKVQRNIVIEGNVLSSSGGSAIHITGRPATNIKTSFDSDQQLFTRGFQTHDMANLGSLVVVDANTPITRPDPASCVNESVVVSIVKNKMWFNKRDGLTMRHIVLDKCRIAQNDFIENRNSGIWMQRVKKSAKDIAERRRAFELFKNRCNKSHQEFGLYMFQVDDSIIEECEMKENQASGVMIIGDTSDQPLSPNGSHNPLRLSNIHLVPSPEPIFQPLASSQRKITFKKCTIEKNRDNGVYVIDYLGLVELLDTQVQYNFQSGLALTQRIDKKVLEGKGLSLLKLKEMHESGLLPRVLVGEGCKVRENWKHAITLNFVQLTIDRKARVEVMGAQGEDSVAEENKAQEKARNSPLNNKLLLKYKENKEKASSDQNYAVLITDSKGAWLLVVNHDPQLCSRTLSANISENSLSEREAHRIYRFPNVIGRIGGPRWGQYAAREEASMQSIMGMGNGADSQIPSTRRAFDAGTPRPGPSLTPRNMQAGVPQQGFRSVISPRQFLRSQEKISEQVEDEKSGDKSKEKIQRASSVGASCISCVSPKNRIRTLTSKSGIEEPDELQYESGQRVEVKKPKYVSALEAANIRKEPSGGEKRRCVCGVRQSKRVGDAGMEQRSPRNCVIF